MPNYVQAGRPLTVKTQLGDDKFLLAGVQGREALSTPFAFHLDLRSEDPAVDGAALLRTPVSVVITTDPEGTPRYVNGVISRFVQLGRRDDLTAYYAEVVPWVWLLSLARDCRIFQDLSVLEIAQQVFQNLGFKPTKHFRVATTKAYAKREYCVQYRETDLDFVSRLLEEEGIFYFFEHTADGKHTLVLADANATAPTSAGMPKATMGVSDGVQGDAVTSLRCEYAVHTGKVTIKDYDFLQPALSLQGSIVGTGPEEVYDYPGRFTTMDAGERLARLQLEADEALALVIRCTSTYSGVQAGTRFDLEGNYRSDLNQNYLILEANLSASAESFRGWDEGGGFDYRNEFLAIPSKTPYRPQRRTPRPIMPGSQTAVVVGKPGEEVWADKYGRVKVQFHWDRQGKKDDKSSCWVRVLTPWGGKGYGSVSIPRIGNEVVVSFIEGDPDRPIITGSVYNADQMPPYALPGSGIQMGMKSRSSPGGGGQNEITMTDTKGKELINIHAQYDMTTTVEHDRTTTVKNNDTLSVSKGNRTISVDTGTHTEKIKGNTAITIVSGAYSLDVQTGTSTHHVKGAVSESYDADQTTTVKNHVTINGGDSITLKSGSSSIVLEKSGKITIHGKDIAILGDSSVKASAETSQVTGSKEAKLGVGNQQVTCDTSKVNVSGAAINSAAVGQHEITGAIVKIN